MVDDRPKTFLSLADVTSAGPSWAGGWKARPYDKLRAHPHGTAFLLRVPPGRVHVCELCASLPEDDSCRALRLSDGKVIRLENLQRAEFILLCPRTIPE